MNESLHKFMKVGLVHFMAYPTTIKGEGPVLETIKKLALDDYFTAIEITTVKDKRERKKNKTNTRYLAYDSSLWCSTQVTDNRSQHK